MASNIDGYDVIIVGSGAVGSALALRLSQLKYRVALIDLRKPSFEQSNPERVIALSEGSSRFLQSLGVWDEVIAGGVASIRDIVVCEPGETGQVQMSHDEIKAEALGHVVEIRHVVWPLHQALAGQVDILCPAQCISYESIASGVRLQVKTAQGMQTLSAKLLVGADGTNSQVRRLAGIQTAGWDHNRTGIVASLQAEHGHGHVAYECFRQQGPLALLPLADDRFSLVWSVAPRHSVTLMQLNDELFLQRLLQEIGEDVAAKVGGLLSMGRRACFPLEFMIAKSFAAQGVLLVGNAAHTVHPIAGQGMNLGFRDVAVLSDVLQQSWAKNDASSALVAQTYAERRRLDTLAVAGFTEGVLETFSSSLPPLRWLRSQGLHATQSISPLKQLLLHQAAGMGQLKGLGLSGEGNTP